MRISFVLATLFALSLVRAAELPVTQVVLFSSGVNYVQRSGDVHDTATVEFSFKPEQVNDLLKSMIALDLDGGTVGAITYANQDPISKTLQSFSVNLADNPTLAALLTRLRGEEVVVSVEGENHDTTGRIISVETKQVSVGKEPCVAMPVEMLNLLTDDGIKYIPFAKIESLQLKNEARNKELKDALTLIATGADNQRKPVKVTFNGTGQRRAVVGYLTESPVWKTSYRLVLGDEKNLIQGWAIVENTSDADWNNIHLSLISGRPISFIQDLYTPLYIHRPVVQPTLIASVNPVTYDDAVAGKKDTSTDGRMRETSPPHPSAAAPSNGELMAGIRSGSSRSTSRRFRPSARSKPASATTWGPSGRIPICIKPTSTSSPRRRRVSTNCTMRSRGCTTRRTTSRKSCRVMLGI